MPTTEPHSHYRRATGIQHHEFINRMVPRLLCKARVPCNTRGRSAPDGSAPERLGSYEGDTPGRSRSICGLVCGSETEYESAVSITPVQVSTPGAFAGSLTATTSLTGVTANNHIIVAAMHEDTAGSAPTLSCSDGQGSYGADVVASSGGGVAYTALFRLANASAGTHSISVVASGGTAANSKGAIVAFEVPPVVLDQSSTGGSVGTAVSVAATATLAASGDLAIAAVLHANLNSGGGTFPPTGGTGTYTSASVPHTNNADCDYQTLTSTAGVGANWGTFSFSGKWTAAVGAYTAVPSVVPFPPTSLGGMNVQVCQ
jgi:hypothetical protein